MNEIDVLRKIGDFNEKNEPVWFSKLVDVLGCSRIEVSKALDRLSDLGMVKSHYEKMGQKWSCCYFIEDEAKILTG